MEENITAEFVKKWIEKHHLTRNSYESVLSDALTNNGHYYIDNPYLRDLIKTNAVEFRELLPHELNENQQRVLDWLKNQNESPYQNAFQTVFLLVNRASNPERSQYPKEYFELLDVEMFQVLQAFAEWGLSNEQ